MLSVDDCFLVPQGVEQLVEVPPTVSQQSRAVSSAQMVKQRLKVPKSRSRAWTRVVEQIADLSVPASVSTRDRTDDNN